MQTQEEEKMIALTGKQRLCCQPLFADVPIWRAFIESAMENGYGQIITDSDTDPEVAVLFYGGLVVYVGKHDSHIAEDMIRYFDVQPAIIGYSKGWNRRIKKILGDRLEPAKRYHLPHSSLRYGYIEEILAGHDRKHEEIGVADYAELQTSLGWEHHLHHYKDRDEFLKNGNGFIIKRDGRIISGASSFAVSVNYSECQVTTVESERRRGFARLVSAAYLYGCLNRDLKTPWDAANESSVRLGQSLGFANVTEYDIFEAF